jgi:hypothetical protein
MFLYHQRKELEEKKIQHTKMYILILKYITLLYMIGRWKMNDRLNDMTPNGMLLEKKIQHTSN